MAAMTAETLDRVAVLADVHGVVPALEAVLAEPDVRAADAIVLAGDIALGPQPVETLDLLSGLGDQAIWVNGNCDRQMVTYARTGTTPNEYPITRWSAEQLRPDQVELLAALPTSVTRTVEGLGPTLFCHATPRDDEEMVVVDSRLERWAEVNADVPDEVRTIVCGHTHMPYVRLAHGRLIVNPGSVGMPYGLPGAQWALLGAGGVALRRTTYDIDSASRRLEAESSFPGIREFVDEYARNCHSEVEALTAFAAADGRS
jgi:predicted phosphodiesterase